MRYSEEEVRAFLTREEGLFLDFKSLWDQSGSSPKVRKRVEVRKQIAEYVAAFANAEGGVLILGVESDGSLSGHGYPEEAITAFGRVPSDRLDSPLDVEMQRHQIDGHELLIFETPNYPSAVMVKGDGFPLRVQDTVVQESEERINARKQAARAVAWEGMNRAGASLDELDKALAAEVLAKTPHASRPVEEVLERYGLVAQGPRDVWVSNAALLLFGKEAFRWHPRAGVRIFRVQGTSRKHGASRNVTEVARVEAPLPRLIAEVHDRCDGQIRKSEKLHDLFFREFPEYPTFAWQEAIVNAVGHRDYSEQGREIEVWFYDDRMEVTSPGRLVQPVTLEALQSRHSIHVSRNPLVVRVLVEAGIMREEGEGIPRMFEEMEESFLELPGLSEESGLFRVTLRNTPILEAGNPEWQSLVDRLPISIAQKRVLVANPGGFTSRDYQSLNRVDRDQAYREIQELVAKEVVISSGKAGRGARYRISPEISRSRAWLEERVPTLREFFAEHAKLTNASYRELFGVERYRAVRELQRLREAGVLRQKGEKRGAHYVLGPGLRT